MQKQQAENLLEQVKDCYNQIAEDFSRTRQNIWPEVVFLFNDYLKKGDKVLDLGCGNGRYLPIIQENKAQYIGVDNSEELIKIAQAKYGREKFSLADGLNLPFGDSYFDKIYSIAVLHHIPSQEKRSNFLGEVARVLKPKGLLILTVWQFKRLKEKKLQVKYTILKLFGKCQLDFKDIFAPWGNKAQRYYHCFSRRELKKLAKKAGLKVIKTAIVSNSRGNRNNIYLIAQKV